jgi:hypothetical protein
MLLHDLLIADALRKSNSPATNPPDSTGTTHTIEVGILTPEQRQIVHVLAIRAQHLAFVRTLTKLNIGSTRSAGISNVLVVYFTYMYTLEIRYRTRCLTV